MSYINTNPKTVEHDGELFLEIDPTLYAEEHAKSAILGSKFTNVTAHKGTVGEKIITKMKDGLTETINYVHYEAETGEADWVVTQVNGEKQIVADKKFKYLYNSITDTTNSELTPTGRTRPLVRVEQNVCFVSPWGETQYLKKGGYLIVMDSKDIYGIQKAEFEKMYNVVDQDGSELLLENLKIVTKESVKPKIFLCISYPNENEKQIELTKQILRYVYSKDCVCVNVKKITNENTSLLKEITKELSVCDGILTLAYQKKGNTTSPFVHIENSLAYELSMPSLTIMPSEVEQEGVLFSEDNNETPIITFNNPDLFDKSNQDLVEQLDILTSRVIAKNKNALNAKDIFNFKSLLKTDNTPTKETSKQQIVGFIKNRYSLDEKKLTNLKMCQVYVKKPVEIRCVEITEDGMYETKNGKEFLHKGDFLATDIDDKVYSISKKVFEETYVKVAGEEDKFVKKLIPVIATKEDGKLFIAPVHDLDDKYAPDIDSFKNRYITLEQYIMDSKDLNLTNENPIC